MKKLHTFGAWERPQAALLQDMLAKEGINCLLKNADLTIALGEVPLPECFPELWVIDDEMMPRATLLLKSWLHAANEKGDSWQCPSCLETLDSQFGACWSCGREREP